MGVRSVLDGSQSCLASLVVHLVVLVGLGLVSIGPPAFGDQRPLVLTAPLEAAEVEAFAIAPLESPAATPLASAELETIADLTDAPKLPSAAAEVEVDAFEIAGASIGLEDLDRIPVDVQVAARPVSEPASSLDDAAAAAAIGFDASAYASAAKRLGKGYGTTLATLRAFPKDYVVVVRGAHDQMEAVLAHYKIPHLLVDVFEPRHLDRARILCLNCGCNMIDRALLRRWVTRGGVVISSDYALSVVSAGFPDYVLQAPGVSGDEVFGVARRGKDTGLLKNVFADGESPQWWLESASYFVAVDSYKVEVLVTSDAMAQRYDTTNVVACHFEHGRGRVLHLVGHFHQRRGNVDGLVAMHRLVFNLFLEEAPQ